MKLRILLLAFFLTGLVNGEVRAHRYAIVVGVDDYVSLSTLNYAEKDARDVASALRSLNYDEVRQMVSGSSEDLYPNPTRILRMVKQYASIATPRDTILVYFSGHGGAFKKSANQAANLFLTYEADPESLYETGVDLDQVIQVLESSRAANKFLVVDGGKDRLDEKFIKQTIVGLKPLQVRQPGLGLFFAVKPGYLTFEPDPGQRDATGRSIENSLFTHFFLEGLQGYAADRNGYITAKVMQEYLDAKLSEHARSTGMDQFPLIAWKGNDLSFANAYPGTDEPSTGMTGTPAPVTQNADGSVSRTGPRMVGPNHHETYKNDITSKEMWSHLIWKTCVEGKTGPECKGGVPRRMGWSEATAACGNLNQANGGAGYAGQKDWRIPSLSELLLITDFSFLSNNPDAPLIDLKAFPGSAVNNEDEYWSSTEDDSINGQSSVITVYFDSDTQSLRKKSEAKLLVRCVAGRPLVPELEDLDNGSILDRTTGLIWQQCVSGQNTDGRCSGNPNGMSWNHSKAYCENLVLAGSSDWRLPMRYEMNSILLMKAGVPQLVQEFFPGNKNGHFWTASSGYYPDAGIAHRIGPSFPFSFGNDTPLQVRCVRGP